jgi:hypothetical protein
MGHAGARRRKPGRHAAAALALAMAGVVLLGEGSGPPGEAGTPAAEPSLEAADARMLLDLDVLQDLELLRELEWLRAIERLDRPTASGEGAEKGSP